MKYVLYTIGIIALVWFLLPGGDSKKVQEELLQLSAVISDRQYYPPSFEIPFGSRVKLTVKNLDNEVHGLNVAEFAITGVVQPGQTRIVEFVADYRGQTSTVCSATHPEKLLFNVI